MIDPTGNGIESEERKLANPPAKTVWRVLVMNPVDRQWRIVFTYDDPQEAIQARANFIKLGRRARIKTYSKPVIPIKPPNNTQSRRDREAAEQQMSDRADALKKYKSPG